MGPDTWAVSGTYFEACNCEAVCPCRRRGGTGGGRSTFGICDFALSWRVERGHADGVDLAGAQVVLAGSYDDDEPGSPWRVALYVDERRPPPERDALADIFLGRAGGAVLRNFAAAIGEIHAVRPARIHLEHARGHESIHAGDWVEVRGVRDVVVAEPVTCGIPGHEHPGTEVRTDLQRVDDGPLRWEVSGRCGFATDFAYTSD